MGLDNTLSRSTCQPSTGKVANARLVLEGNWQRLVTYSMPDSRHITETGLFRIMHVGTTISGGPPMTKENVQLATRALNRVAAAKRANDRYVQIPEEALSATGATSVNDLELRVEGDTIVLRRKRTSDSPTD